MTRTIMAIALVATLSLAVAGPGVAITQEDAGDIIRTHRTASNYCSSVPDSLRGSGWVPGNCR